MATEGYNGIRKKKVRRVVDLVELDMFDEYLRSFCVTQL